MISCLAKFSTFAISTIKQLYYFLEAIDKAVHVPDIHAVILMIEPKQFTFVCWSTTEYVQHSPVSISAGAGVEEVKWEEEPTVNDRNKGNQEVQVCL